METRIVPMNACCGHQIQDYRFPILQDGAFKHNGTIFYTGFGHGHIPVTVSPMPGFPYPEVYALGYQAFPRGSAFDGISDIQYLPLLNCTQQPFFPENLMHFGHGFPVAYHSQVNSFITPYGTLDHTSFPSYEPYMIDSFTSKGQDPIRGYLSPHHCIAGLPWMNFNGGLTRGIYPANVSSPFSFTPMQQDHLEHYYSVEIMGNTRNEWGNSGGNFGGFSATSGCPSSSSGMILGNAAVMRMPDDRNCNQSRYESRKTVRTSLNVSYRIPHTNRVTGNASRAFQSGRPAQAQRARLTHFSNVPTPHGNQRSTQTNIIPHMVWRRKTKPQPSVPRSKPPPKQSTTTVHHIRWNGFDETVESVEENCQICYGDLVIEPTGWDSASTNEYESSNLQSVAVLSCGHAFHAECLQLTTPEQTSDPSCHTCANGKL